MASTIPSSPHLSLSPPRLDTSNTTSPAGEEGSKVILADGSFGQVKDSYDGVRTPNAVRVPNLDLATLLGETDDDYGYKNKDEDDNSSQCLSQNMVIGETLNSTRSSSPVDGENYSRSSTPICETLEKYNPRTGSPTYEVLKTYDPRTGTSKFEILETHNPRTGYRVYPASLADPHGVAESGLLPPSAASVLTKETNELAYYKVNSPSWFNSRRQFQGEALVILLLGATLVRLQNSPYASLIGKPTTYDYVFGVLSGSIPNFVIDLTNPSIRPNWLSCVPPLNATERQCAKGYSLFSIYSITTMAATLTAKGDGYAQVFRLLMGASLSSTYYYLREKAMQRGVRPRD